MTRNNLDSHIFWLLSNEVTPPVGVHTILPEPAVVELEDIGLREEDFEEDFEGEDSSPAQSPVRDPVRNRIFSHPVEADFARPPIPPPASNAISREHSRTSGPEAMGKHGSAQKSTASGFMSQRQLATPASTTTSTAASSSSLTLGYADFLRKNHSGTPTTKPTAERLQSRLARTLQTPQTPRQTPRLTVEPNFGNIESVDLTGDHSGDDVVSRSSSTEIVFGDPKVVWTPAAAARPEPLPRTSRKRKSDEMPRSSVKKRLAGLSGKSGRTEDISLDGFMDIDEMVPSQSQPEQRTPRVKTARPSIEAVIPEDGVEEYQVTETICRTETLTRKSISRVPSVSDGSPGRRKFPALEQLPASQKRPTLTGSPTYTRPKIQVARSPIRKHSSPSVVEDSPSPHKPTKHQRRQQQRIIQDSDEENDDMILDNLKRASRSPPSMVKNSPKVRNKPNSPKWQDIPDFDAKPPKVNEYHDKIPRVGSPLRPISKNVIDMAPSPFPRSSPGTSSAAKLSDVLREEATPPSTFTADDKILVNRYLSKPSALDSYAQRVKNLKLQSSADCMEYTDSGQIVPPSMRDERVRILDMEKAYDALGDLFSSHQRLKTQKKNLARQISELLDLDVDTSVHEERQSALTREMRECEKEIGKFLHASGAINDGFGTGSVAESHQVPPKSSSNTNEAIAGSSTIGSAHVILQTQFPSLQRSTPSSYQAFQDSLPLRPSPRRDVSVDTRASHYRSSPSPVRMSVQLETHEPLNRYTPVNNKRETPVRHLQQQSLFQEASPANYGVDDDAYFNDFIMNEAENEGNSCPADEIPGEIEDEYGDSDEDDFLEIAQKFENKPSLPESTRTSISNTTFRTSSSSNRQTQKIKAISTNDMYSHVDSSHAGMLDLPWSKDVKKALRERFHLRGFRQNQLDAINATLSGKDVFVLMPTGGGKSLCYQLPAIVQSGKTRGVTVVISPLLSLMSDQVDHLKKRNIQAVLLNGEKAKEERELVFKALRGPYPDQFIQVLYITPEMIGKSAALVSALGELHKKKRLARIVIDEAHCVSQWGHDFRPDYKTLANVRRSFPGVPFMALTATATENVKADCIHNLGMQGCKEYKQSFNRPNLYYEIRPKAGKGAAAATVESMIDLIKSKYKGQTGIVYTLSRANCEDLADKLQEGGIRAHHFHAHMQPEEKTQVQRDWQAGKWQVVVATIAFGMGIDKPDVRFVIHHTMPKSLEGYYQETGRAGRDGKPSGCYLYYGFQDTAVLRRFIEDGDGDPEVKEQQRQMLNRMVQFCENRNDCRRAEVLAYFGESFSRDECNNSCDNCNSDAIYETVDMSDLAKTALRVIKALQSDNVTLLYVVDILRGSKAAKIKAEHQNIAGHGSSKSLLRGEVERLLIRLLTENAIVENNVFNKGGFATPYLHLGPSARDFLNGRRKFKVPIKVSRLPMTGTKPTPKRNPAAPTSTLFTSPISPSSRREKGKGRAILVNQDRSNDHDRFLDDSSEDDAFEPVRNAAPHRDMRPVELGPPITTDGRMDEISDVHRAVVDEFVMEAKKTEEKLRNNNSHSRRYFSESEFREMAINWTLSLDDMNEIPGIDSEKVARFGNKFIPLIRKFHKNYEEMMNQNIDRDMDKNHRNVIDLCDDDDEDESEEEEEENFPAEHSRFFVASDVQRFNQDIASAQQLPQKRHERPVEPAKKQSRGGFKPRGKGRGGGRRKFSGRSNGSSASAASHPKTFGNSSVSKKVPSSRRASGSFNKKNTSTSSNNPNGIQSFKRTSGEGGGTSGGIMGMPM